MMEARLAHLLFEGREQWLELLRLEEAGKLARGEKRGVVGNVGLKMNGNIWIPGWGMHMIYPRWSVDTRRDSDELEGETQFHDFG